MTRSPIELLKPPTSHFNIYRNPFLEIIENPAILGITGRDGQLGGKIAWRQEILDNCGIRKAWRQDSLEAR